MVNTAQDASGSIPSSQSSSHIYRPLTEDDELRLLLVEPGQGVLRCRLTQTRLSSLSHSYECISYAWEYQDIQHKIETPDGPLSVPRTLHDALLQLRDPTKPRYIWAAHACVSHRDWKERSHQARLTGSIFKTAERVLIWLGADTTKKATMAFSVLCGVASGGEVNGCAVGQANFYIDGASSANMLDIPCRDSPPPASFRAFWGAVAELFGLGWFWRVGCIQEVCLAAHRYPVRSDSSVGRRGAFGGRAVGLRQHTVEMGWARGCEDSKQPPLCPAAVWHAGGVQRVLDVSAFPISRFPGRSSAAVTTQAPVPYQSFCLLRSSRARIWALGHGRF